MSASPSSSKEVHLDNHGWQIEKDGTRQETIEIITRSGPVELEPIAIPRRYSAPMHHDASLLIGYIHNDDEDQPEDLKSQTKNVAHVGFAEALAAQQPKKWTKAMMKLYFFLMVAFLNSMINAYNTTLIGSIRTMEEYKKFFNMDVEKIDSSASGSGEGVVMSIYAIGNIVGSFFCGPFTDWWGRRWGMFSGAILIILGSIIQGLSTNLAMFVGGRFMLGFAIALCATAGPCYVAEMAHPAWRGPLTGLYNSVWNIGAIPAVVAPLMTSKHLKGNQQWRVPLYFQILGAGLLVFASLFIPETPRWLYAHDKKEMAVRVLEKYHGEGNRKSPIVMLTYRELVQEVFIEGSDKRWWDFSGLYNSKAAWWRNACIIGMAFCSQWCGNATITFFMPVLTHQAGIVDDNSQTINTVLVCTFSLISAIAGAMLVDRIGRRRALITGNTMIIIWWAIITVLMARYAKRQNSNVHGARAAIAFINIFSITYSFCFTPLQVLYPVECLSFETRAKGMGVYNLCTNIAAFFNTYGIPTIMDKIKWRFYFVYVAWNSVQVAFMYYFFVETRGRTLEEINEIFKAPYPKAKSLEEHTLVLSEAVIARQWEMQDLNLDLGDPHTSSSPVTASSP